jgi:hypothetical protein
VTLLLTLLSLLIFTWSDGYSVIRLTEPVKVSISDLRHHPEKYDGKIIQLVGKLTECAHWECSLCPEEMTNESADPKQCLPLGFRSLINDTGFGSDAQEAVFRFASVTIRAKFDPECLRRHCTDRGTVLRETEVVEVRKRRESKAGLWLGPQTKLVPVAKNEEERIIAAALNAGYPRGTSHDEQDPAFAVVMRQYDPLIKAFGLHGEANEAIVCYAPSGSGTDPWPVSIEGALYAPSTNDRYHCNSVRKLADQWILQVQ